MKLADLLMRKKKKASQNSLYIAAPCDGEVLPLSESKDEVFRDEVLGKGCFVYPKGTKIYSPVNGVIESLFPTKHAVGIRCLNGVELLLHLGINTVQLNGKFIDSYIKEGDEVKKGTLLAEMDFVQIKKAGYEPDVYVILLNSEHYDVKVFKKEVNHGEVLMEINVMERKDVLL